jgi:hypothetical protein
VREQTHADPADFNSLALYLGYVAYLPVYMTGMFITETYDKYSNDNVYNNQL